jgi:hypothetical protein
MEEVKKKKRGRPRKTPLVELPSEIEQLVQEVREKEEKTQQEEFKEIHEEVRLQHNGNWDFTKEDTIDFFDANYSYELTGYRPIDKTHGLDFNPDWFTETRETFLKTGHYCQYPRNTKAYADFWDEQYLRCINGMTVNNYTITGDHYFFLNFYQLMDLTSAKKAGSSRIFDFPKFSVGQYQFFHYIELARCLRLNAVLMKARGIGYSEINASIIANSYNSKRNSVNVLAAQISNYVDKTNTKITQALDFLNGNTDGGFFKLRQVKDQDYFKRASVYKIINGQKKEDGWMSQIQCIVADKPNKIRGDRTDLLVYEELGSWPNSTKAFIQGDALTGIQGARFGLKLGGGTGGDTGAALEGLRDMYYKPEVYDILPYRHNYTATGEQAITAYFIPVFTVMAGSPCTDARGWTDPEKGKAYYDKERAKKANDLNALITYSAEYCYNAEEAFSLEGDNKFNKLVIAEQLANIRLHKIGPEIHNGSLSFTYKNGVHTKENISGFKWDEHLGGKVHILEHPIWTDLYKASLQEGEERDYSEMNNLYVAGIDAIDIGAKDTSINTDNPSKFCITIKKRAFGLGEPQYVAYYKDRPDDIREAYKIAMCLAMYYKAIINIEATRVSMLTWAREKGYYNYFMARPRASYPDPTKIGRRTVGTPATAAIIDHQTDLIANYIVDYGHNMWFEEMLDELNRYTDENKTHFDIVASMGMTELADEELGNIVPIKINKVEEVWEDVGYYTDERGYKRWGVIPKKNISTMIANSEFGERGPHSSDPRNWNYE